jgi:hypothetical protein
MNFVSLLCDICNAICLATEEQIYFQQINVSVIGVHISILVFLLTKQVFGHTNIN